MPARVVSVPLLAGVGGDGDVGGVGRVDAANGAAQFAARLLHADALPVHAGVAGMKERDVGTTRGATRPDLGPDSGDGTEVHPVRRMNLLPRLAVIERALDAADDVAGRIAPRFDAPERWRHGGRLHDRHG